VAALEVTNARLDSLFDQAPVGLCFWDRDLTTGRRNAALIALGDLPAGDGQNARPLVGLDVHLSETLRRVAATGRAELGHEVAVERPGGGVRHFRLSLFPVRTRGAVTGVGAVCEDVTEQTRAEAELRASERRFRALADATPELVWTL